MWRLTKSVELRKHEEGGPTHTSQHRIDPRLKVTFINGKGEKREVGMMILPRQTHQK